MFKFYDLGYKINWFVVNSIYIIFRKTYIIIRKILQKKNRQVLQQDGFNIYIILRKS